MWTLVKQWKTTKQQFSARRGVITQQEYESYLELLDLTHRTLTQQGQITPSFEFLQAATTVNTLAVNVTVAAKHMVESSGIDFTSFTDLRVKCEEVTMGLRNAMQTWIQSTNQCDALLTHHSLKDFIVASGSLLNASDKLGIPLNHDNHASSLERTSALAVLDRFHSGTDAPELAKSLSLFCRIILSRSFRSRYNINADSPEVHVCKHLVHIAGNGEMLQAEDLVNTILVFSALLRNNWSQISHLSQFSTLITKYLSLDGEGSKPSMCHTSRHNAVVLDSIAKLFSKDKFSLAISSIANGDSRMVYTIIDSANALVLNMLDKMDFHRENLPSIIKYLCVASGNVQDLGLQHPIAKLGGSFHALLRAFQVDINTYDPRTVFDTVYPLTSLPSNVAKDIFTDSNENTVLQDLINAVERKFGIEHKDRVNSNNAEGALKCLRSALLEWRESKQTQPLDTNPLKLLDKLSQEQSVVDSNWISEFESCLNVLNPSFQVRRERLMCSNLLIKCIKKSRNKAKKEPTDVRRVKEYVRHVLTDLHNEGNEFSLEELSLLSVLTLHANRIPDIGTVDIVNLMGKHVQKLIIRRGDKLSSEDLEYLGTIFYHLGEKEARGLTIDLSSMNKIVLDKVNILKFTLQSLTGYLKGLSMIYQESAKQSALPVWCTRQIQSYCIKQDQELSGFSLARLKTILEALTSIVRTNEVVPLACLQWEKQIGFSGDHYRPRFRLEADFEGAVIDKLYEHALRNPQLTSDWSYVLLTMAKISWRRRRREQSMSSACTVQSVLKSLCQQWISHFHLFRADDMMRIMMVMTSSPFSDVECSNDYVSFVNKCMSGIVDAQNLRIPAGQLATLVSGLCLHFPFITLEKSERCVLHLLSVIQASDDLSSVTERQMVHLCASLEESSLSTSRPCLEKLEDLVSRWRRSAPCLETNWIQWIDWFTVCLSDSHQTEKLEEFPGNFNFSLFDEFALRYPVDTLSAKNRRQWRASVNSVKKTMKGQADVQAFATWKGIPIDLWCPSKREAIFCEMPSDRVVNSQGQTHRKRRLTYILSILENQGVHTVVVPVK